MKHLRSGGRPYITRCHLGITTMSDWHVVGNCAWCGTLMGPSGQSLELTLRSFPWSKHHVTKVEKDHQPTRSACSQSFIKYGSSIHLWRFNVFLDYSFHKNQLLAAKSMFKLHYRIRNIVGAIMNPSLGSSMARRLGGGKSSQPESRSTKTEGQLEFVTLIKRIYKSTT